VCCSGEAPELFRARSWSDLKRAVQETGHAGCSCACGLQRQHTWYAGGVASKLQLSQRNAKMQVQRSSGATPFLSRMRRSLTCRLSSAFEHDRMIGRKQAKH
jgi:hypothetical protein